MDRRPRAVPPGRYRRRDRLRDQGRHGESHGRAIAEKIPFGWVSADAAYGHSTGWRCGLEQADVFHVMATTRQDSVVTRRAIEHVLH